MRDRKQRNTSIFRKLPTLSVADEMCLVNKSLKTEVVSLCACVRGEAMMRHANALATVFATTPRQVGIQEITTVPFISFDKDSSERDGVWREDKRRGWHARRKEEGAQDKTDS